MPANDKSMTTLAATQRIAVVGTGKLARALALSLPSVSVVAGRNAVDAASVASLAVGARGCALGEIASGGFDVLWITTSDAAIANVVDTLTQLPIEWNRIVAMHSSGAFGVAALEALSIRGARVIALHPNASLRGDAAIPIGTMWGVTPGDDDSLTFCEQLLSSLSPRVIAVREESRPLYHAAASVASNFSVTLYAIAELMYERAGIDPVRSRELIAPYMLTSVMRANADGANAALTGPVSRGDDVVIDAQRAAISSNAPELLDVFDALIIATRQLLAK
ncbi:MAG: DUF2520 domain-containing protein [bacterium]|nr:DUF2520 domain-containing protein [Candidatus Kapabacteria bacterium]